MKHDPYLAQQGALDKPTHPVPYSVYLIWTLHRSLCTGIAWLSDGNRKGKWSHNWIEVYYFLLPYGSACDVSGGPGDTV